MHILLDGRLILAQQTGISRYLLGQGCKLIVVACNAASAAALHHLRHAFPETPFVGMEPAVKPAAEHTHSGVVGVLATPATFQGALYASVVERFGQGVTLLQNTCPGLVQQIEAGNLTGTETRQILEQALQPMLAQGIDTVVLGCTHYPLLSDVIAKVAGKSVTLVDSAGETARAVAATLESSELVNTPAARGALSFLVTDGHTHFREMGEQFLGHPLDTVEWVDVQEI